MANKHCCTWTSPQFASINARIVQPNMLHSLGSFVCNQHAMMCWIQSCWVQARRPPPLGLLRQFGACHTRALDDIAQGRYQSVAAALADSQRLLNLAAALSHQLLPGTGTEALFAALQPLIVAQQLSQAAAEESASGVLPLNRAEVKELAAATSRLQAVMALRVRSGTSPATEAAAAWLQHSEERDAEAAELSDSTGGGRTPVGVTLLILCSQIRLLQHHQQQQTATLSVNSLQHLSQAAVSEARQVGASAGDLAQRLVVLEQATAQKTEYFIQSWCILFSAAFLGGEI